MHTTSPSEVVETDVSLSDWVPPHDLSESSPDEPKPRKKRIAGIDLARGLAVVMMTFVDAGPSDPDVGTDAEGSSGAFLTFFSDLTAWCAGRANVTFFIISGLAAAYVARSRSTPTPTAVHLRRGAALFIAGVALNNTVWPFSILEFYGIMFLLIPWLLKWSNKQLLAFACFSIPVGTVLVEYARSSGLRASSLGGYFGSDGQSGPLEWTVDTIFNLAVTDDFYPLAYWAGYFCLGMAIGRIDFSSRAVAASLAAGGLAAALVLGALGTGNDWRGQIGDASPVATATEATSGADRAEGADPAEGTDAAGGATDAGALDPQSDAFWEKTANMSDAEFTEFMQKHGFDDMFADDGGTVASNGGFEPVAGPFEWSVALDNVLRNVQRAAISLTIVGSMMLLPTIMQRGLWPLGALGMMPLTGYIAHVEFGLIMQERASSSSLATQVLVFWGMLGGLMAFSMLCIRLFKTGPFEWVLKHLSGSAPAPQRGRSS